MPPPTTSSRSGRLASSSAPVESMMRGVVGRAGHAHGLRARGDDALLEADDAGAALAGDRDPVRRDEARLAAHDLHLALLGERAQTRGQAADDAVLPRPQPLDVDLRRAEHDAGAGHRARLLDDVRGVQQRLRRNAANVQAHAAERRPALDQADLEAEVRGAERRGIAARARAEHHQREGYVRGGLRAARERLDLRRARHAHRVAGGQGRGGLLRRRRRRGRGRRGGAGREQREHGAFGDAVADLDAQLCHDTREGRRHVHRGLVALERDQRVALGDRLAERDQHLDDRYILEIAERGHAHLAHGPRRIAHGTTASSSPRASASAAASAVVKRAASAPSMTRWS